MHLLSSLILQTIWSVVWSEIVTRYMGGHPNLRDFYQALDPSHVEERPLLPTDFFPHSGYEHDIFNAHLTGLLEVSRPGPFAQRGQSRQYPMIYAVGAREE
jgi:hypothetical protein